MINKRRDKATICADILAYCRVPHIKTHIIYACNLNFPVFKRYERHLIERGMLMKDGNKYSTTMIGAEWLRRYSALSKDFGVIVPSIPISLHNY